MAAQPGRPGRTWCRSSGRCCRPPLDAVRPGRGGGLRDLLAGARRDRRRRELRCWPTGPTSASRTPAPLLADVPDCAGPLPGTVQLWPHRHGTDAMFLALLRRR